MPDFTLFVEEMTDGTLPDALPHYMIAISPTNCRGGMGTKSYSTKEELAQDLKGLLCYTDRAVERFFASEDKRQQLLNHALSGDAALYFGWAS